MVVCALVDGGAAVVCALLDGKPVVVVDGGAVVVRALVDGGEVPHITTHYYIHYHAL